MEGCREGYFLPCIVGVFWGIVFSVLGEVMPVPKSKQKAYGVIVGKNINEGKSLEESKGIADRAVKHKGVVKKLAKMVDKGKQR